MKTIDKKTTHDTKAHKPLEATALLKADHKLVDELFSEYESARTKNKKKTIVEKICTELIIHAKIEEEIFYPKVKSALKDHEMIPEAVVEHETLRHLIGQLRKADILQDKETYDAKVKVLCEYVKHHVKEEQNELFPKVKKTNLDLDAIGRELQARKEELKKQLN